MSEPRKSLGESMVGKKTAEVAQDLGQLYQLVEDKLFPMTMMSFLSGVKSFSVEFKKNELDDRFISRLVYYVPASGKYPDKVNVTWNVEGYKSGVWSMTPEAKIEYRRWLGGTNQYTISGPGGCLWIEGNKTLFVMEDGSLWDINQWRAWRENQLQR